MPFSQIARIMRIEGLQLVLVAISLLLIAPTATAYVSCEDESGNPVDWWVIYKMPALKTNLTNEFASGFRYAYMDANQNSNLMPTKYSLDKWLSGALGSTLNVVYKNKSVGYLMWNDETPDEKSSDSRGHTKGVMAFSTDGAYLLRHSVPRFPNYRKDGYKGYPEFAHLFGQTMICVSMTLETLSTIAGQYLYNAPLVYDAFVPTNIASRFPNISMLAQGMTAGSALSNVVPYRSRGGQTFYDFAKSKRCNCELYTDVVAPYLSTGLRTLTWGRPLMSSYCKPRHAYDVTNVQQLSWGNLANGLAYKETKEHSKWAVSSDKVNWACIGDINRMDSQADRGGGTTCFYMSGLWRSLKNLIAAEDTCKT